MANYNNGGLTTEQIKAMQNYYGTPADGAWGKNSTAAAGGLSAQQAWQQMQQNGVILDPTKTSYYTGNSGKYQLGDWVGGDVAIANAPQYTGSGGGSGDFYNGGLTTDQIKAMQSYYGTTADGMWGKNSSAAAGGLSAEQAWQQYQQNGGKISSSGSNYNNGGLTTDQIKTMQSYYGTAADGLWGQNSTAAAGGLTAEQAWQQYQQNQWEMEEARRRAQQDAMMEDMMSFDDFYNRMGGADYEAKLRETIAASVQQAVNAYEAQQRETETDAAEMARQAYIAKMLGQKNIGQQLAAGGYAGGMTESTMLESEANYQNQLYEIERQRQRTLNELQRAIENARLTGDMEMAQQLAAYMRQMQSDYAGYYDSALAQQMQAQEAAAANAASSTTVGGNTNYGGSSYANNGGVSPNTVMLLQQQINSTLPVGQKIAVDGVWGPATAAAANGMSASQYLDAYENYMNRNAFKNR